MFFDVKYNFGLGGGGKWKWKKGRGGRAMKWIAIMG